MPVTKTPTSSLSAIELFVNKLWYRTIAKIKWLFFGSTQEVSASRPSPIAELPQELVEAVISYFIYDTCTLLACSMTCFSWYIAAVPYLHHSLTTDNSNRFRHYQRHTWPRPLRKSYQLGLLPLVKRFRIRLGNFPLFWSADYAEFTPRWLGWRTMRYFSALTNLQDLGIDCLEIPMFMPTIRQCFGHFSPTLRFLALKEPRGSCRQILYFIGLFPNLQDLKLNYHIPLEGLDEQESAADAALVPLSIPPLRGRLTLTGFTREKLMKDMADLFGGLRFRHMDLLGVKGVRFLLDACTETLETLRLYSSNSYENADALFRDFNLSRNRSLRTLETTAESINRADAAIVRGFLKTVLSSVTSPTPLDLIIVYRESDFSYLSHDWRGSEPASFRYSSPKTTVEHYTLHYQRQLRMFREIHSARDFRLVLCADVSDCLVVHAIGTLECIIEAEKAKGGLDYLLCEPLIISERRTDRTRYTDHSAG